MNFCKSCFYPNSKPSLEFNNDGICSACISFEERKNINWKEREKKFLEIIEFIKKSKTSDYDCIIPVSGGKDSTFQVIKALEYKLKPLCVNSKTCDLTSLGRKNLDNIRELGVDLIEVSPDPIIRRKLNKIGLLEVGDISWPEHVCMFTIPFNIALKFNIKFMIWGENSQNEYGGPEFSLQNEKLDRSWLEEFGGLLGLRVNDLIDHYGFNKNTILPYIYPDEEKLKNLGLQSIFLGHFFPWDGYQNALIAKKNGFEFSKKLVEGTSVNYENLDNYQTGIHDYFKFLKYGFGRTTDIVNNLYRRKIISKEEGINKILTYDGEFPHTYLGEDIRNTLKKINVTFEDFISCCDKFTNKKLFKCKNNGELIKENNRLVKINNIHDPAC